MFKILQTLVKGNVNKNDKGTILYDYTVITYSRLLIWKNSQTRQITSNISFFFLLFYSPRSKIQTYIKKNGQMG